MNPKQGLCVFYEFPAPISSKSSRLSSHLRPFALYSFILLSFYSFMDFPKSRNPWESKAREFRTPKD